MKKKKLTSLAMIGIGFGLLLGGCGTAKGDGNGMSSEMKTFYEQLDPNAQKQFLELDSKHRKMAMEVIESHGCQGSAACKGIREKAVEEQYNNQKRGN